MAKQVRGTPTAKTPTEPTERKPHHVIEWVEVTGGFLKGARFELADGLNCIIGGRGTGKTTVLEMIRYVLGLSPDEPGPGRARSTKTLVQKNLAGGHIRIGVRTKLGMGYVADRAWNDKPQVYNQQGQEMAISLDRELVFKADIYSQNEIEEIATDPTLQLALIDKFVDEDLRRIEGDIRKVVREMQQSGSDLVRLQAETRDLADAAMDAPALEEKLKALQEPAGPDAALVNQAHDGKAQRQRELQTLTALGDDLGKVRAGFDSLITALVRRLDTRIDRELLEGPNKVVFSSVAQHVRELTGALERAGSAVARQVEQAERGVAERGDELVKRHAKQDAEYRALVSKSDAETGRAAERSQLQLDHARAAAAAKELALRRQERAAREAHRLELSAKLSTLRTKRFELRKTVAERLTQDLEPMMIRVTITQAGNRDAYRGLLTEALKNQGMKHAAVVERILDAVGPDELCVLVQRDDPSTLADRTGLDVERSRRVVQALKDTELVYELESVEVQDLPHIELRDGRDYKDSADLSTGQRCTTILPILLLESERPLLVDQPEDNLDNAFIYDTVVKSLLGTKGRRQLVFVTHNPNVPVLGDAERVFVLASDGKQGKLLRWGTVDERKDDIEALLEGGRQAFQLRMQRYGH